MLHVIGDIGVERRCERRSQRTDREVRRVGVRGDDLLGDIVDIGVCGDSIENDPLGTVDAEQAEPVGGVFRAGSPDKAEQRQFLVVAVPVL